MEIRDKKDSENVVIDHQSRLDNERVVDNSQIQETFSNELLLAVSSRFPWYDFVNFLACRQMVPDSTSQ